MVITLPFSIFIFFAVRLYFYTSGTDEVRCHRGVTQYHNILLMSLPYRYIIIVPGLRKMK